MRWTVPDENWYPEQQDVYEIRDARRPMRLRTRYCVLLGILGALAVWAAWAYAMPHAIDLSDFAIKHWAWLIALIIAGAVWVSVYFFVEAVGFFADHVGGFAVAWIVSVLVGALFALELDSPIQPISSMVDVFGSAWALLGSMATGILLASVARRWSEDVYFPDVLRWSLAGIVTTFVMLTTVRGVSQNFGWEWIGVLGSYISVNRGVVVVAVTFVVNVIAWRFVQQRVDFTVDAYDVEGDHYDDPDERNPLSADRTSRLRIFRIGVVALIDIPVILYLVLVYLPPRLVEVSGLTPAEAAQALADERRTLLAVVAGVGAGITLLYTHLRHQLERDANATGRYTQAIEQIGSTALNVRLGGIYALERLQRDSPGDAVTVLDVLSAFVREMDDKTRTMVTSDVIAALRVLGGSSGARSSVDLRGSKLAFGSLEEVVFPSGADLRSADLTGANMSAAMLQNCRMESTLLNDAVLTRASMHGARLAELDLTHVDMGSVKLRASTLVDVVGVDVNLSHANMRESHVQGVRFTDSDLYWTDFNACSLIDVYLRAARLRRAQFDGSQLDRVDFSLADLRNSSFKNCSIVDVDFTDADLAWVKFSRASLKNVTLVGAKLHGADLRRTEFEGVRADGALYNARTTWPPGFDPSSIGAVGVSDERDQERDDDF